MRRKVRQAPTHLWLFGAVAATAALSAGFSGCQSESEDGIEGSICVSNDEYFSVVFFNTIKEKCGSCHIQGEGSLLSEFDLVPTTEAGFLTRNFDVIKDISSYEQDGISVFLQKPLGKLDHGGGTIFTSEEDPEYLKLVELVNRTKKAEACPDTEARYLAGVQMTGPTETYRKAALVLAARLPTAEENKAVEEQGWAAVDVLLDNLMQEKAFYERLKEKYNDLMLTDFYLSGDFDVIGDGEQYDPRWYEQIDTNDPDLIKKYGAEDGEDLRNKLEQWTQRGVARAAVELISYTVKNNIDYRNIVTADNMVFNPFSAKAFKIPESEITFENDADPNEFKPARLGGYESEFPHAGVLTDPIWLQRHPTTQTNRNRHRAKEVLFLFLGNDILKAAERPIAIDENSLADNPTLNNQDCTVCHAAIDPIAGAFRNFQPTFQNDNSQFAYRPDSAWFPEMFQTGFKTTDMPPSQYPKATQWLGQQIANDPGFAFAAVFMAYRAFTGNEPLSPPQEGSENFDEELTAYLGQYYTFSKLAEDFMNKHNYDFKKLVKDLVMTPYFRAINTAGDIDPMQVRHLTAVGSAHLLTPEQLNRKLENVVGIRWTPAYDSYRTPNLLDGNPFSGEGYKILFGGIDSRNTTVRITSPSGIMANVAERMGLEVGCRLSNAEFSIPQDQRQFFKEVELLDEPQDANFRDVPDAITVIKGTIVHLHERLLGEKLDINSEEITRTYDLFVDVWKDGKVNVVPVDTNYPWECTSERNYISGTYIPEETRLHDDGLYTGRAWAAVLAYLLTDYDFLYE